MQKKEEKMYSALLAIIYLAFISLGLPDTLLGSAWPQMHIELNASLSSAGIITMIISLGTVISSLLSDKLNIKLGTGKVTAISVLMTAVALLGFSLSHSFIILCVLAVPYGLGAGAVDAALNNYVALHYSSKHMSWLHCFWGVGASIGPYIIGTCMAHGLGWRGGYSVISVIQFTLTAALFIALPLWKKVENSENNVSNENNERTQEEPQERKAKSLSEVLHIKGVIYILFAFFCYSAVEQTTTLWCASYLVLNRSIDSNIAAKFAALFYIGITFGRFLCGFIADKLGDKNMIRLGIIIIVAGIVMLFMPIPGSAIALAGLITIGLGCAPIYPSIIHSTPFNFGADNSQAVIGIQMAFAYVGTTFMPPLFGLIAQYINIGLFPVYILIFTAIMFITSEALNNINKNKAYK